MKLTAKIYLGKVEEKRTLNGQIQDAQFNEDWNAYHELTEKRDELLKWFDALPLVNVSFLIGYRSYYRGVVKIGKSYFTNGEKMTKSRGYYCIEEIEEITEDMRNQMMADSYYY